MKSQTLKLLKKEIVLGNSTQSIIWIVCCFGMYFIPNYPLYIGPFYITLCTMMTFALNQSSHDLLYTVLLPVRKIDTVKARFLYCGLIEILSLVIGIIPCIIRNLPSFPPTVSGIPMNLAFFGLQLIVYSVFNLLFLGNVYKNPLKPGLRYMFAAVAYFIAYALCELPVWTFFAMRKKLEEGIISELPALAKIGSYLCDYDGIYLTRQCLILGGGILIFAGIWYLTFCRAARQFEKYDM